MLDLPGIIEGAKDGKGRGRQVMLSLINRQVIAVARTCSLIFIVLDVLKPLGDKRVIERELEGFGIRLNKKPPAVSFRKKEKGGINMTSTVALTHLDSDQVKAILSEYKIHNADISFRYDATVDEFIDVLEGYALPNDSWRQKSHLHSLHLRSQQDWFVFLDGLTLKIKFLFKNSTSSTKSLIPFPFLHITNGTLTTYSPKCGNTLIWLVSIPNPRDNYQITPNPLFSNAAHALSKICVIPFTRPSSKILKMRLSGVFLSNIIHKK